MSDWEDEVDEIEKEKKNEEKKDAEKDKKTDSNKETKKNDYEDETEEIIEKKHVSQNKPIVPKEQIDYEKIYNEKNSRVIKDKKDADEKVKDIKDEQLKIKKRLEIEEINRIKRTFGVNDVDDDKDLEVEKDFINLAKRNVAKLKAAKKPEAYTYSYLYNEIDLLCPDLSSDKINDLKSLITTIFNKKLKEEGGKSNKKKNKPTLKSGKMQNNNEKNGIYNQYADDDGEYIEEEEEEGDDFM
jgi:hypothetical protein